MSALDDLLRARGIGSPGTKPAAAETGLGVKSTPPKASNGIIYHDVVQGTPEWAALRSGIPTASQFDRIVTPKGKISTQAERYMFDLLAERMMGHPIVEFTSHWMDRGTQMEAEAVNFYEFTRDQKTVKVGFITNDEGTIGASPDRLVGDDGLLQIKVPKEGTHVGYLIKKAVDAEYFPQVQGELWLSGRAFNDVLSYHPEMPEALIRVERDSAFIAILEAAVTTFSLQLERQWRLCIERGWAAERKPVDDWEKPLPTPTEAMREILLETKR